MPTVPTTGIRDITLRISDGTRSRTFACMELTIPNPSDPERLEWFVEGVLRGVGRGNNAVGDFSFTLPFSAVLDASQPTMDEILGGTGAGATWVAQNDALAETRVHADFRVFTYTVTIDGRKMGGTMTTRTWQGYAARSTSISRADPNTSAYTGRVYGTITDAAVG